MSPDVVVLGSANLDLVYAVDRIPRPGETVLATSQDRHPGGKGLNQAIASARAGASTAFIGAVGADDGGAVLAAAIAGGGLDGRLLRQVDEPTGTAVIAVDRHGENAIVVAAGANGTMIGLTADERAAIDSAGTLVLQLETPLSIVADAASVATGGGTRVILNAAPAQALDDAVLDNVDVLVVNEHEARLVAGADAARLTSLDEVGRLLARRVEVVVITLGERGARWFGAEGEGSAAAPEADVVDTTGAGDAFTGFLAASLTAGISWPDAVMRAVVAGAIAVESQGAAPSIPTSSQVDARISG
jgi:ribokinase